MDLPARLLQPGFVVLCTFEDGKSIVYGFEPRLEDAESMVAEFLDKRAAGEQHPSWAGVTPRIVEGHITWSEGFPAEVPDPLAVVLQMATPAGEPDPRTEGERNPE